MRPSKFLKNHNNALGIKPKIAEFDPGMKYLSNAFRHGDFLSDTMRLNMDTPSLEVVNSFVSEDNGWVPITENGYGVFIMPYISVRRIVSASS